MTNNIKTTNRQSAKAFKAMHGIIEVKESKKNPGKFFFVAGDEVGCVSPRAMEALNEGKGIDAFQVGQVSIDGKAPIWCLMVVGNSQPTLHSL